MMVKRMFCAAAIVALASPAIAATEWTASLSRGMETFSLKTDAGQVTLVCDPDRVFGATSNGNLIVAIASDPNPQQFAVLAASGAQSGFTLIDGAASEAKADPAEWKKMVDMIRAGGAIAFVSGTGVIQIEAEPLDDLKC